MEWERDNGVGMGGHSTGGWGVGWGTVMEGQCTGGWDGIMGWDTILVWGHSKGGISRELLKGTPGHTWGDTGHCMGGTAGTPNTWQGSLHPSPQQNRWVRAVTAELGGQTQSCDSTIRGSEPCWHRCPQHGGPGGPAACRVLPWGDPARRILAPALPFQRLNLPLRAMLCQVEKSQNKAAWSTKTPPPCGREQIGLGGKE